MKAFGLALTVALLSLILPSQQVDLAVDNPLVADAVNSGIRFMQSQNSDYVIALNVILSAAFVKLALLCAIGLLTDDADPLLEAKVKISVTAEGSTKETGCGLKLDVDVESDSSETEVLGYDCDELIKSFSTTDDDDSQKK